jgi:hypothetical protein
MRTVWDLEETTRWIHVSLCLPLSRRAISKARDLALCSAKIPEARFAHRRLLGILLSLARLEESHPRQKRDVGR